VERERVSSGTEWESTVGNERHVSGTTANVETALTRSRLAVPYPAIGPARGPQRAASPVRSEHI
jgi:hypothetical protein